MKDIQEVFPTKLTLAALLLLLSVFLYLLHNQRRNQTLVESFYKAEVPSLQMSCGATRLLGQIETDTRAGNSALTNQLAFLTSVEEIMRIAEDAPELAQEFRTDPDFSTFETLTREGKVVEAAELVALKSDLQDYIERYLTRRSAITNEGLRTSQFVTWVGIAGMVLFFALMGYIHWLFRKNTETLARISKRLEDERLVAIHTSKMASLGEVAAGLAHEINNPLTVVVGRSEMLLDKVEAGEATPEELKKSLQRVLEMGKRIGKIVNSMRRVSRGLENMQLAELKVEDLISDVQNLCAEKLKNNQVRLDTSGVVRDLLVYGDFTYTTQILINLVNNAADELEHVTEKSITIAAFREGEQTIIAISDSGCGIPPQLREKLFQPFFTTKEIGKGTGLGLSVSRNLAIEMGGSLELDAATVPTIFRLKLPAGESKKS